jgi:hypothetical protein
MEDHDKLSQELGTTQDGVAGIELTDEELDAVAGGGTTIVKTETTIIT